MTRVRAYLTSRAMPTFGSIACTFRSHISRLKLKHRVFTIWTFAGTRSVRSCGLTREPQTPNTHIVRRMSSLDGWLPRVSQLGTLGATTSKEAWNAAEVSQLGTL